MILDEDLTEFEKAGKLSYLPVVQNPDENWTMAQGRINEQLISNFMPQPIADVEDSIVMCCGPPKLRDSIEGILKEMEWSNGFMFK